MTSMTAEFSGRTTTQNPAATWRRVALAALTVGAASSVAFAVIALTVTTSNPTPKDLAFHHTGDYWYTGIGIPTAIATAILLFALRALQPTARPRLTLSGATLNAVALGVLAVMLTYSVATGAEARGGGTYVIATLATFIAHALFIAGTWRTGLFPRPVLAVWPVIWLIGAFAAQGASPLLLVGLYLALAAFVVRRS